MESQPKKSRNPMGTSMIVIALIAVLGGMWFLGEAMSAQHEALERKVDGANLSIEVVTRELRKVNQSCEIDREAILILAERIKELNQPLASEKPAKESLAKAKPAEEKPSEEQPAE